MRSPPSLVRMVARAAFVVVFVTMLLLPGLTAPQPKPHFAALRRNLDTLPLVNIGATAAVGLVLLRVGRHWRARQQTRQSWFRPHLPNINSDLLLERMNTAMQLAQQLSVASIYDAVKLPGANGLASPPFEIPTGFFGLFSWQHVEEGTEALIIDGKTVRRGDPALHLWKVFDDNSKVCVY